MAIEDRSVWIDDQKLSNGDLYTIQIALELFLMDLEDEATFTRLGSDLHRSYERRAKNLLIALEE